MAGGNSKARVCRKSTKGKGKRWLKGYSCSSNPVTTKFRDAARSRFFQLDLDKESKLTVDAVKKHDTVQQLTGNEGYQESDVGTLQGGDLESVGVKTFDTFASNWTACTNPSFDRLLKKWSPNSAVNKDRLAILAAVAETIKSHGGKETETEYYAALMTTLDTLESDELITACVTLIGLVIKRLSPTILKVKFSESSKVFMELLGKHVCKENPSLMKGLIGCLSVMLRAQEAAIWGNSSTLQTYQVLLSFTTNSKPRVRKAAQHAICAILKGSSMMLTANSPAHHPASLATAKFCCKQLEEHGGLGEATSSLHILGLLKDILAVFPQQGLKTCCETILRMMTLGNVLVTSCCFQALHGLFVNMPKSSSLPAELNAQLISALYDFQPSLNDAQSLIAWLTVMKEAHINLLRLDANLCVVHLARLFSVVCRCWLSQKSEVHASVTGTLKALLYECSQACFTEINVMLKSAPLNSVTPVHKMFQSIETCLSYQYNNVWKQVFHVLAVYFEVLGSICHPIMKKCIKSLADLRKSTHCPYVNELDYAFGKAIRSMGPGVILECIPFDFHDKSCSFEQSWLLPVLRENIRETRLGFFVEYFLPVAFQLKTQASQFAAESKLALSKSFELLHNQIWSLLPGFCTLPTDLRQSFKTIAKTLGTTLADCPELRLEVMAALRLLILKNIDNDENTKEMAKFAKNYLPILFNLYTTPVSLANSCDDGVRLAVYDTIKVYIQITDQELCASFFDKAIDKVESSTDTFVRQSVMDIVRVLVPKLDFERTQKVYEICLPMIEDSNRTTQKKAYRIYEELCSGKSRSSELLVEKSLQSMKEDLFNALSKALPSAKAPRLRCLGLIVSQLKSQDSEFILSLIPEIIICTKEVASKVRTTAAQLLITIGQRLLEFGSKSEKEILCDYVKTILAGFGGSSHMISATILSLGHVFGFFREQISSSVLQLVLDNIAVLLLSKENEVVGASLNFLKTILSNFRDIELAQHIEFLVQALANMADSSKSHFRMQIRRIFQRLIRKFGFEMISRLTPDCFRKLVTFVRKAEARSKKKRASTITEESDDDEQGILSLKTPNTIEEILHESESDSEDEHNDDKKAELKKNAKKKTWIKEGNEEIVDLLDPKASQNILASRPDYKTENSTKDDFKVAPDGRLIIIEEDKAEKPSGSGGKIRLTENIKETIIQGKKRKVDDYEGSDEDEVDKTPVKYQAGGIGIHRPIKKHNQKSSSRVVQAYGSDYKAKLAGGDMKRKGKPDPYAYVPLNTQALNKRKKAKFAGQFKGIVRGAQKGARRGYKSRNTRGKAK